MFAFNPVRLLTAAVAVMSALGPTATAVTAAEWRKQAIYQVVTDRFARTDVSTTARCDTSEQVYCGGSWRGLISKLDYIQGMGCRSYVDYGTLNPFSSSSYFHSPCSINYDSQTSIEACWQGSDSVSLPDLRTEDANVRHIWNDWISNLVSTYSIDGIRIDSAKHVETSFYAGFNSAAGVFAMGEVFNGDPVYLASYQKYMDGLLDYARQITRAFQSTAGSISDLVNGLASLKNVAVDLSLYGSFFFLENHDQARFPSPTNDVALVKNAIAFAMLKDGIPVVYQGQEQRYAGKDTPFNREAIWLSSYSTTSALYTWVTKLNQIRTRAASQDTSGYLAYKTNTIYSDSHTIATRKGNSGSQLIGVFTNVGSSSSPVSITLTSSATGFTANQPLVDVMSCSSLTTDSGGNIAVTLTGGAPRVLYPLARLSGSSICPSLGGTATLTTSIATPTATPSCSFASVSVTFNELLTTIFGDTAKVVGNTPTLGNWNPASAIALDPSKHTSSNPLWFKAVNLAPAPAPASVIQYKFIKVSSFGL